MTINAVCLFCGAADGASPRYLDLAREFGREVARQGLTLVFGGGRVGLMGAAADAALAAGGRVVGVIPEFLKAREVAHLGLSELHVTHSMHERKALMAELSDAFVALPGGFGTLDELFEIVTWAQLGVHHKPIGLLDADGFYQPLLQMVQHMATEGFVRPAQLELLQHAGNVPTLLARLASQTPEHSAPGAAFSQI